MPPTAAAWSGAEAPPNQRTKRLQGAIRPRGPNRPQKPMAEKSPDQHPRTPVRAGMRREIEGTTLGPVEPCLGLNPDNLIRAVVFHMGCSSKRYDLLAEHWQGQFSPIGDDMKNIRLKSNLLQPPEKAGVSIPPAPLRTWLKLKGGVNQFVAEALPCSYSKPALSMKGWRRCREEETQQALTPELVGRFLSFDSSNIYSTVQAVSHALQVAMSSRLTWRAIADSPHQMMQAWQLHPFLQLLRMNQTSTEGVYLDADGDLATDFDLLNFVLLPNNSFSGVKVGSLERDDTQEIKFSIDQDAIVWPRCFKQVGNSTELLE
ncbi:hypothetical protein lerEdw1_015879 [Lerista edwardsae]|nr:hypothetical protein lerEdw1_015879 [Lerista edwardsae]